MSRPIFIYVTYINSTPGRVWQALTDPAFTRKYWVNHRNASDWKVGSEWRHEDYDDRRTAAGHSGEEGQAVELNHSAGIVSLCAHFTPAHGWSRERQAA